MAAPDEIIRLRRFGYTYGAIAARLGVSREYVGQVVRRLDPSLASLMQDDVARMREVES